jgi:hypothetical protein
MLLPWLPRRRTRRAAGWLLWVAGIDYQEGGGGDRDSTKRICRRPVSAEAARGCLRVPGGARPEQRSPLLGDADIAALTVVAGASPAAASANGEMVTAVISQGEVLYYNWIWGYSPKSI